MTTCVARAPNRLRASVAAIACVVAVGLCLLLIGLARAPHLHVGGTFQFIPRTIPTSSASFAPIAHPQTAAAGGPSQDLDSDPPCGPLAALPSPLQWNPALVRLAVVHPAAASYLTRIAGTVTCRGPPA